MRSCQKACDDIAQHNGLLQKLAQKPERRAENQYQSQIAYDGGKSIHLFAVLGSQNYIFSTFYRHLCSEIKKKAYLCKRLSSLYIAYQMGKADEKHCVLSLILCLTVR